MSLSQTVRQRALNTKESPARRIGGGGGGLLSKDKASKVPKKTRIEVLLFNNPA